MSEKETTRSIGAAELIQRSGDEIRENWVLALSLIILTAIFVSAIRWLFGHKDASAGFFAQEIDALKALPFQEAVWLIAAFFWNDEIGKRNLQNFSPAPNLKRMALFVAYAIAVLLLGAIIGVILNVLLWIIIGSIYSEPGSGAGDVLVMGLPATLILGIFLGLPFLLRFFFIFPAIVFQQKTSLSIAWKQSAGWGRRLLAGTLLFGLLVAFLPSLWGALAGTLNLIFVGYVAHAYLLATGLSKKTSPTTIH